ncbi:MAG: redoxin domain-containing protein, partial [Clostridia bacterium]|nr:redoxin domain-containing protein [Clostridia bacterium]
ETVKLSDELKTHDMVLINFWYDGCSACELEFPYMEASYERYAEDVSILALSPYDDALAIRNFQSSFGLTFEMGKAPNQSIVDAFSVEAYPTSVVIDRYGVIALVEVGALTSERQFDVIFDHFTGDNYEQMLVNSVEDITPKVKPDVTQPSSSEVSAVFDGRKLNVTYTPDGEEYSWPFVITEKAGVKCLAPGNGGKKLPDSYAIIYANVELAAGEALAFDYFSSSELGSDRLYVIVDGKDIRSISGVGTEWETCYGYVAEEAGTYEVAFCYMKDGTVDEGEDTVYISNLRSVDKSEVDIETYIYRFAATNPDIANIYQDYITPVFNANDGYYHVNSADGPILLADLMGYTLFNDETTVYYIAGELLAEKLITEAEYDTLIDYCSHASNATIYGVSSVTEELAVLLKKIASMVGRDDSDNEWLLMCCYYDAYGTPNQLEDPIKGLATFSAYPVIEGGETAGDGTPVELVFPNTVVYDRLIMPRGLLYKFTPTRSGTYRISSFSEYETNGWIFRESDIEDRNEWLAYQNVYRECDVKATDNNCYMIAYLEAGKDYYIDIAYYDVYQYGTIYFKVERLTSQDSKYPNGEGYYRFSAASPGYFTYYENTDEGTVNTNKIVAGGINVELKNGYWYEKRTDGRAGSLLYADFTETTGIFNRTIEQMIAANAFDFSRSEDDQYILNVMNLYGGDKNKTIEHLKAEWGTDYDTYYELYKVEDVLAGIYHGTGADYTDLMRSYISKKITVGYNSLLGETIAAGDSRIGCVVVDAQLATVLQILMDKYTFAGVENSWTKVCYYSHYFCAATPI